MSARRLFLYLAGGGGLTAVLAIVALLLLWGSVRSTSDDLLTTQASENQLVTRAQSLIRLSHDYRALEPSLGKLGQALPTPITPEIVINSLRSVAASSGVTITSYDFGRTSTASTTPTHSPGTPIATPAPLAPSLAYTIKLTGSYGAMQAFLARTAVMTPVTDVRTINLTKPVKEADRLDLTFQMESYGGR